MENMSVVHHRARLIVAFVIGSLLPHFCISPARAQEMRKCMAGVNYPWAGYGHDFGKNAWGHDGIITGGWTYQTFAGSDGFTDTRFSKEKAHTGAGSLRVIADFNK